MTWTFKVCPKIKRRLSVWGISLSDMNLQRVSYKRGISVWDVSICDLDRQRVSYNKSLNISLGKSVFVLEIQKNIISLGYFTL